MLDFCKKYSNNVYSQNGEDGIISEALRRMKINGGLAIEFGGADGFFCSNVANLKGWKIIQYDIEPKGRVIKKEITEANVNDIGPCRVLSIDIDGNDYNVWKAYYWNPDIVIIEINSSLNPLEDYWSLEHGCNFSQMVKLAYHKHYFLLCHTGNLVFVSEKWLKKFPEIPAYKPEDIDLWFNKSWLC